MRIELYIKPKVVKKISTSRDNSYLTVRKKYKPKTQKIIKTPRKIFGPNPTLIIN
jgi:hypothetical protein